jgi:hypothetical protein
MTLGKKFQPTRMSVRYEMVSEAVKWVCNRLAFTIDRQHMNPRNLSERLDDGVMGEIASVAVMQFLMDHGRYVVSYDQIRTDNYMEADPGWDVLSSREAFDQWLAKSPDVKVKPGFAYSFSIKSSRIPKADNDEIDRAIEKRDFKIFKKSGSIDLDLTADFEVQVYYLLGASVFEPDMKISAEDVSCKNINVIIKNLRLMERYSECFLSGAASRQVLINYSNSLPAGQRYWSSYHAGYEKQMWRAPLQLGTSFQQIIKP